MEKISQKEFDEAMSLLPEIIEDEGINIPKEEFSTMLQEMQNPVNAQKRLAVQVKIFLDKRINDELNEKGLLGENTRKWVESYSNLLEKLQRSIHGDKSVNLHVHKVSHGDIMNKIRDVIRIEK